MATIEQASSQAATPRTTPRANSNRGGCTEGSLLLGTSVAGRVRGPRGQPLLLAEPRYSSAAFAPPKDEESSSGTGDITSWYPPTPQAGHLFRAGLARRGARTAPTTPAGGQSTPAAPKPTLSTTPPTTPGYMVRELAPQGRLPTLLPPPPELRATRGFYTKSGEMGAKQGEICVKPGQLCMKRGIRPPPGLTELSEREEQQPPTPSAFRPPPGLSRMSDADGKEDLKGDTDTCSTAASRTASLVASIADSP